MIELCSSSHLALANNNTSKSRQHVCLQMLSAVCSSLLFANALPIKNPAESLRPQSHRSRGQCLAVWQPLVAREKCTFPNQLATSLQLLWSLADWNLLSYLQTPISSTLWAVAKLWKVWHKPEMLLFYFYFTGKHSTFPALHFFTFFITWFVVSMCLLVQPPVCDQFHLVTELHFVTRLHRQHIVLSGYLHKMISLANSCTGSFEQMWFDWLTAALALGKLNFSRLWLQAGRLKRNNGSIIQFGNVWHHRFNANEKWRRRSLKCIHVNLA